MCRDLWIENNTRENHVQVINECQKDRFAAIPDQDNIYVPKPAPNMVRENSGYINATFLHVSNK